MSRIEESLKKLRTMRAALVAPPDSPPADLSPFPSGRSAVPIASRKKVAFNGVKHHVSQEGLIRAGLLAPVDRALAVADEFRKIKRPLLMNAARPGADASAHMNIIMIASALPGAGKTFCAVNLAVSISLERELNVLLVDADVAKPHVSREFGLDDQPGLIDLVLDETLDIADTLVRTDLNDIQVLPAGQRHAQATELLASERMSKVVHELAVRYPDRIVIVDSPPLLITSEAQALASQVGQIALVIEAGRTSPKMLQQTAEMLDSDKPINVILNKARRWGRRGEYGGDYGYYGYGN